MNAILLALYLQIPVVIGGVLHMWVVTHNKLPSLVIPVHEQAFGANKTWRGFVVVPLLTAFGALWLWPLEAGPFQWQTFGQFSGLIIGGLVAGLGYMLGELPNSYIKRRIGIAPGAHASSPKQKQLFIFADQIDSAIGVAIAYAIWPGISLSVCFWYIVTFPITALVVKRLLFYFDLKKQKY